MRTRANATLVFAEEGGRARTPAASLVKRVVGESYAVPYAVRLWTGERLQFGEGAPEFTVCVNHPGVLRRMAFSPGDVSLGNAFVRGWLEVEGDLIGAVAWADTLHSGSRSLRQRVGIARDLLRLPRLGRDAEANHPAPRLSGAEHSVGRDRAAVQFHYDLPSEFFALWLDARMVYSCAYFRTGEESLDAAQQAKLELICRKLGLHPGETLLDMGCGWGGLVMYAAEHYGVNAVGITLSERQARWAQERIRTAGLEGRARVELRDYRELDGVSFDKIASVGMTEHVGRAQHPDFFARAWRLLKPGGLFLHHAITAPKDRGSRSRPGSGHDTHVVDFISRYVFPDTDLVPLDLRLGVATTAGFEVRDVESWREHYATTLRHWLVRLEARAEEAAALTNEATYRTWRLYLAMVAHGFDAQRLTVYQEVLAKPEASGASAMPRSRATWYAV
jgi:cyclopropane-fatty-acyl-phospholipid synthase